MKTFALMAAFSLSFLLCLPQISHAASYPTGSYNVQDECLFTSVIQVFSGYTQASASELTVNYSGTHNFANDVIRSTQVVRFTNAQGQAVSLTLAVRSYSAANESLQVSYALGGNNLSGLTIATSQSIVIEDFIIN